MAETSKHANPWDTHRFCPACGAAGIEVRADRSVLCRRCGFHFYFNTAAAVAGLIEDDIGRLLMIVRAHNPQKGSLDLPGGFVDFDETAEDALKREIKEELNLEVKECSYFKSFPNIYNFDGIINRTLDFAFFCTVESFTGQKLSDEVNDAVFVRPAEINLTRIGFDSIRNMVSAYLRFKEINHHCS